MRQVHILNYGSGNLYSLAKAFEYIDVKPIFIGEDGDFHGVRKLVLPGVGAFGSAMNLLKTKNLIHRLDDFVCQGSGSLLGICLGFQLLFDSSDEASGMAGLSLLPGHFSRNDENSGGIASTNVGFRPVEFHSDLLLMSALAPSSYFYFTHSYCLRNSAKRTSNEMLSFDRAGNEFVAGVVSDNVMGVQFHPEKSQANGLKLLKNFMLL